MRGKQAKLLQQDLRELKVAYWLKHWTADRKVQRFISLPGALSPTPKIE